MKPVFYAQDAQWRYVKGKINYFPNSRGSTRQYFTMRFDFKFEQNDKVYFSFAKPYTYTQLQTFLKQIKFKALKQQDYYYQQTKLC